MKTQTQSLAAFLRQTQTLHKNLRGLIERHPEDALEPDDRIFSRILTNDWRYFRSFIGPMERRYLHAVKWSEDFNKYYSELCEFCVYSLNAPAKPAELPVHPGLQMSASECIRRLELQCQVIKRWLGEATDSVKADALAEVRADLEEIVRKKGMKTVEAEVGVSKDTFRDLLSGKTKPQQKTLEIVKAYVKRQKSLD
jgi:DNA-binding phage protein